MHLLFIIDRNPVITKMFETLLSSININVYTLNLVKDATYFIKDLRADVLLIDSEFDFDSSFINEINELRKNGDLKKLLSMGKREMQNIEVDFHFNKPLDTKMILQYFKDFSNKH